MNRVDTNAELVSVSTAGFSLASAHERGDSLAWSARVAPKVFDLLKLQRSVRSLCADSRDSAIARAMALDAAFAPLSPDAAAQVAVGVVCSLRDEQLRDLARGALLTLRDAVSLADAEAGSVSLMRLDEELARRGEWRLHEVDGVRILGDEVSGEVMALAVAKVVQELATPAGRESLRGKLVLVTHNSERKADDALLRAHLALCARRTFGSTLAPEIPALTRLDATVLERLAPPVQTRVVRGSSKEWLRSLFARRAPNRVPMAVLVSIQSR